MTFAKRSLKMVSVLLLCFVLVFTQSVKKADAFVPVVIAGLSLGEALFAAAGVAAAGYGLYEAYNQWVNDSPSDKFVKAAVNSVWGRLSSSAKEEWAALERSVVDGAKSVSLTASQWMDAMTAGLLGFFSANPIVPAIPLPSDSFVGSTESDDFMTAYAILNFSMNGEKFALMPSEIVKNNRIIYSWYGYYASGGYWAKNYIPSDASAFIPINLSITVNKSYDAPQLVSVQYEGTQVKSVGYVAPDWGQALSLVLDANAVIHGLLQARYGGLAVTVPVGWADTFGHPIPQDKDLTKPKSIPIPPGAITYPTTGDATLELTPDMIRDIVGDLVGDIATPGNPNTPPKGDWPDSLGQVVTTRFPFSLPWDLYGVLALLSASPVTPVFRINTAFMGMPFRFEYSLDFLDPYMPWFRGIVVIGFCIWLIQITRNLLGGAK